MKKNIAAVPYVLWIIIFTILPLSLIVYFAFTTVEQGHTAFSLTYFEKFLQPIYINVLWRSIRIAGISTLLCLLLGYPLALLLNRSKVNKTSFMIFLFILPMWMNFLLRTYAWLTLLEKNGFLNTLLNFFHLPPQNILYTEQAIILGMIYNFLPFMVLPLYTVLGKIDSSIIEAAEDLGANRFEVFYKVIFPLSLPGVISGVSMVFMPAVTTFVIPRLLGGGKINLIGNIIEQQFLQSGNWNFGAALSLVLMMVLLISMGFVAKYDRDTEGGGLF